MGTHTTRKDRAIKYIPGWMNWNKKYATRKNKLHLGCGRIILPGFLNVDFETYGAKGDVVHDLTKFPYPFKSSTFDYVFMHHVLEHLDDVIKTLNELHRITKKGGIVEIHVPHFACNTALTHITHKRAFSYYSFDLFENATEEYGQKRFRIVRRRFVYTDSRNWPMRIIGGIIDLLSNVAPRLYERVWCYWVGGSHEITFELEVVK